jgi:hypothetical protein
MLQATVQGGSHNPWKRQVAATQALYQRYEYLEPDSDEALLDSIDPLLARTAERLRGHHIPAQIETIHD